MRNADRIVPEWQEIKVGDVVWLHPEAPPVPVIIVEPFRALVLGDIAGREEPDGLTIDATGTRGFFLKRIDDQSTRLIVRIRFDRKPGVLSWLCSYGVLEPAHFIMERKMMLGIKQRAEAG